MDKNTAKKLIGKLIRADFPIGDASVSKEGWIMHCFTYQLCFEGKNFSHLIPYHDFNLLEIVGGD